MTCRECGLPQRCTCFEPSERERFIRYAAAVFYADAIRDGAAVGNHAAPDAWARAQELWRAKPKDC